MGLGWLMKTEISTPGKVFLSGEYLVLDGSLATILATKQKANITIEGNSGPNNILHSLPLNKSFTFAVNDNFQIQWNDKDPKELGLLIELAILEMKIRPKNTTFTIDTTEFYYNNKKIGIGSSAAISLALIKAIDSHFGIKSRTNAIIDKAIRLHKKKQSNLGSGLDIIASFSDERLIECDINSLTNKTWKKHQWPSNLFIKGVLTNHESITTKMIDKYNQGHLLNKEFFETLKFDADKVLEKLSMSWSEKNTSSVLRYMEDYKIIMQRLNQQYTIGIYTDQHQALLDLANKFEIFYKPSGAGGGDLGFMLTDNQSNLKKFNNLLIDNNFKTIDLI